MSKFTIFRNLCWSLPIVVAMHCNEGYGQDSIPAADSVDVGAAVETLADLVTDEYFDAKIANRVADELKQNLQRGRYVNALAGRALANRLTQDMFAISKDKHLTVFAIPPKVDNSAATGKRRLSREERGRRDNFGVKRVEILDGNVGYFELTHFYRPDEADEAIHAAMAVLLNTDALIIDMRSNTGGSPGTVATLASYLFDEANLPLFKIISRDGSSQQYATLPTPPRNRNPSKPIYVLTSAQTFSAGEGLALILQERKRAMVVGEVTAGAGNPGRPFPINSQFEVVIPTGFISTAIAKASWEGTGVKPDVESNAEKAIDKAHELARERLARGMPATNPN